MSTKFLTQGFAATASVTAGGKKLPVKTKYQNLSGDSGIRSFEIREQAIAITFADDGGNYLYDYSRPGKKHVDEMIRLAQSGRGLCTYINQFVRENYSAKL